jgi:GTP-binding protein EngB required for normal cell division
VTQRTQRAISAPAEGPRPRLNESHRRSLSVTVQHIAGLLDDIERTLVAARNPSPFNPLVGDISPVQAGVIHDYIERARRALLAATERHGLDPAGSPVDARSAIGARTTMASIAVDEVRPRRLRGYGALDARLASEVDRTCDEIDRTIRDLSRFVSGGPEEDFGQRLARLGRTAVEPELLALLERVLREDSLVEFRRLFRSLLERMEERSFHVAVFGRVGSGKSSLLNALLGAPILPVGVTPVTAVPARVHVGTPPGVRVRYADGRSETLPLPRLVEVASEEKNPGNLKRVARLEVLYPASGLPEGVELVDTPGIGSLATAGAEEAFAYLPRTDLALLLLDVGSAPGPDERALLRLFRDAAIPVEILISKADLVNEDSQSKVKRYVEEGLAREIGASVSVSLISAADERRLLVRQWFEARLAPLFERRRELVEESIRRIAGRLLEGVTAALRARTGGFPGAETGTTAEERRRADALVADTRRTALAAAEDLEKRWGDILMAAVSDGVRRWRADETGPLEARTLVGAAADRVTGEVRTGLVEALRALHRGLSASALAVAPAASEIFASSRAAPDLAGLPVADLLGPLPERRLGRPLLLGTAPGWTAQRLLDRLRASHEKPLREALRVYGYRLRDWADHAVDRLAGAYHGATEPFGPAARAQGASQDHEARAKLRADLEALKRHERNVRLPDEATETRDTMSERIGNLSAP